MQVIKSSLQSKLVVEKDNVSSIKAEKEALEEILNSERSLIVSLKSEVSQLKVCYKHVHGLCTYVCTYIITFVVTIESFEPRNGSRKAVTFEYLTKCHQGIASAKVCITNCVMCMLALP